ncbi:hypothetical protein [Ruthenibacterium lactatiformans]|uniref:hypothetical protein n=1 Tax=Ruthenibacterium lactatiformans TaxID=1550024 RepID=UPI0039A26968
MLCPLCKTEMRISGSRTKAEGDNSPDTVTKVYIEQDLTCTNAQCANHGKIVEQRRAYLIGGEPGE